MERKVIEVYHIWRNLWAVVFTPVSTLERLAGGRTMRVRAMDEVEAVAEAKKRISKLKPFTELQA